MKMKKYDVLIIGAGPAGLIAARTAAEQGLSVAILEKNKDMDSHGRACSMQFILDDGYEGEHLMIEGNRLVFRRNGFTVPYEGKLVPVKNKYYHSPKNHVIHFALPGEQPFAYKFDKKTLLQGMYQDCQEAGVVFYFSSLVKSGTDYGDYVSVNILTGGTQTTMEGKKLIIAEGVNAEVCGSFGLNEGRTHYATAHVVKFILDGVTGVEPNSWNLYYGKAYHTNSPAIIGPSLYGDGIYEMTLTGDKNIRPADTFQKLLEDSPLSDQLKDSRLLERYGCSVKGYASLQTPYRGNVIAIGDTAAFVEVEVQGACMCGYRSALAVAEELKGKDGFAAYTDWWRNSFEFNGEDHLRVSQGYALVPVYTDDELDYLFALTEGKCLQGTYSQYLTPKLIWDEILSHRERLEREVPQIYEKILRMNTMSLSDSFEK